MESLTERRLEADVLVIGAGGAGLRAAIAAHEQGVRACVVTKGDYPQVVLKNG